MTDQISEGVSGQAMSEKTILDYERRLAVTHDIHRAMVSGLRLRIAAAQGRRRVIDSLVDFGPRPGPRSFVLKLKLATVHILNRFGRRHPRAATTIEMILKRFRWTLSRDKRTLVQSRLSLPFMDRVPRAPPVSGRSEPAEDRSFEVFDDIRFDIGEKDVTLVPHDTGAPLVSVVIPCFNYGKYVGEAVESALRQTFTDIEIILVDGGSTDGVTPALVNALEGPRVKVHCRDKPHRVGSNRNFGIACAAGRYVCCLDADDRLDPTYIEKAVFLLEHFDYDVVSTSVQMFGLDNTRYNVAEKVDLEVLLGGNEMATCALFRRSLWEASGGYRDHGDGSASDHVHEDWEFWIRLAAYGARIFNIQDEHLFQYRIHGSASLSRRDDIRSTAEHRSAILAENTDLITERSIERSSARRKANHSVKNPLVNIARSAPPPDGRCVVVMLPWMVLGGAERLLSTVLSDLSARGWRIIVVTTREPSIADGDTTDWFASFTDEIFNLPRYLRDPARWDGFLDYLIASRGATRLLIAGSAYGYDRLSHLKSRFSDLRVHDLLFNTVGHTGNNRRNARYIDRHIVENGEVRDWLVRHGENPDRVSLIPSGVVIPPPDPVTANEARKTLGILDNDLVVGFSGRWSSEKNPLGFIDIAARLMTNPRLRFIMTGIGQMSGEVAARINATPGLSERLSLLFNLHDVANILPAYDVLVVPSKLDGRPLIVLEALALGVPVIASRVGGLPELVRHRSHGALCDPGDPMAFVSEIERLQADRRELARYKDAARAFALTDLDAKLMVRRFEAALAS